MGICIIFPFYTPLLNIEEIRYGITFLMENIPTFQMTSLSVLPSTSYLQLDSLVRKTEIFFSIFKFSS